MTDVRKTVDTKGMSCPMPVIMTAKGMKDLAAGDVMLVEATDAGSRSDIPAWATQTGNEIVESAEDGDVLKFYIRKK
ncbi:MAG: sulfurtransferase TusA family protein [Actinomycetes bacterium]|jgi:tRNA 2-thiouridine synthesizing protein A|nr:sulfurtransferase TusA family protein [Candidatus Nanopelagicales bacterium]MDP4825856.1 sulfurtransferase TusA family protein [Candidatus Nanopelagicales bacterium]MDP4887796.1 sulfurtransferase TusA family protein [Candidatus Nanopelagicales bacterium]|tara:strand:+ start:58 stop:288 length:231 start_codon:yes stop_codon:yes gene_type:complete